MNLKRRILALVLLSVAGGLILAGVAVGLAGWVAARRAATTNLQGRLVLVARAYHAGKIPVLPPGEGWEVVRGKTLLASGGTPLPVKAFKPGLHRVGGTYLVAAKRNKATLVVGESVAAATAPLRSLLFDLALIDAGVLILAAIAGVGLTEGALAPLRRAAMAARGIGRSGRTSGRLPGGEGGDEVAVFVGAVNGLLDRLDAAFKESEVARERERSFVADAGHDLKTPLAVVRGNLDLLARQDLEGPERGVALTEARRAVDRMVALLERLVLAARGEVEATGHRQPVDLEGKAEELVDRFRAAAGGRLLKASPAPTGTVDVDVLELDRALDILMDNAIRYTPEDGGEIRVATGRRGPEAFIMVEDNGPGMSAEDQGRIFERFVRLDAGRAPGGSGLGLSIARTVARAHGGDIAVESAPGRGSRFWLWLPRTDT